MLNVELFWNQCGIVRNSLSGEASNKGIFSGSGAEADHFLAFSRLSRNESGNPLSSWLGAPVFGGALQLLISRGGRRAVGIKAEFAVDAMISQQKWRRVF